MTDREFAEWLRSVPREKSAEDVERAVRFNDITHGEYFNQNMNTHHWGEAQH